MKQTRQAVCAIKQSILIRCLWFHYNGKKSFIVKKWKKLDNFFLIRMTSFFGTRSTRKTRRRRNRLTPIPFLRTNYEFVKLIIRLVGGRLAPYLLWITVEKCYWVDILHYFHACIRLHINWRTSLLSKNSNTFRIFFQIISDPMIN